MHFKIGDKVRRRLGTLGADGSEAVVISSKMRNGFEIVTVRYPSHSESFYWDTYEPIPNDENKPSNLVMAPFYEAGEVTKEVWERLRSNPQCYTVSSTMRWKE